MGSALCSIRHGNQNIRGQLHDGGLRYLVNVCLQKEVRQIRRVGGFDGESELSSWQKHALSANSDCELVGVKRIPLALESCHLFRFQIRESDDCLQTISSCQFHFVQMTWAVDTH